MKWILMLYAGLALLLGSACSTTQEGEVHPNPAAIGMGAGAGEGFSTGGYGGPVGGGLPPGNQ